MQHDGVFTVRTATGQQRTVHPADLREAQHIMNETPGGDAASDETISDHTARDDTARDDTARDDTARIDTARIDTASERAREEADGTAA